MGPFAKFWSMDKISSNFTRDNVLNILEKLTPESERHMISPIVDLAFKGIDDKNDYMKHWNRYVQIVGDVQFACTNYLFINDYSSFGGKVYYYELNAKSSFNKLIPKWTNGAAHGDDVPYVFGVPLITEELFTDQEIELSKSIMSTWTQFAINGSVNHLIFINR